MNVQTDRNNRQLVAWRRELAEISKRLGETETEAEGWRRRAVALRNRVVGISIGVPPAIPAFKAPLDWWPATGPVAQLDEALRFGDLASGRAAGLRVEHDQLRRKVEQAEAEIDATIASQAQQGAEAWPQARFRKPSTVVEPAAFVGRPGPASAITKLSSHA